MGLRPFVQVPISGEGVIPVATSPGTLHSILVVTAGASLVCYDPDPYSGNPIGSLPEGLGGPGVPYDYDSELTYDSPGFYDTGLLPSLSPGEYVFDVPFMQGLTFLTSGIYVATATIRVVH